MTQNGLNASNYADLLQYYTLKLSAIVNGYSTSYIYVVIVREWLMMMSMVMMWCRQNKKGMVMWQEAFYNAYANPTHPQPLPNGTPLPVSPPPPPPFLHL